MRTEQWFHAADFLAPGGCTKLLRFYKVRTTQLPNMCSICFVLQLLFYYNIGTQYQKKLKIWVILICPHTSWQIIHTVSYLLYLFYYKNIRSVFFFFFSDLNLNFNHNALKYHKCLYLVNESSEIFTINVHFIGSSSSHSFFHCLHVSNHVKKKMKKDILSTVSHWLSWLSSAMKCLRIPCKP